MQIVIPMAGEGVRFIQAGYKQPKPLIPVEGKPMISYVTQLFPKNSEFLYICNDRHIKETDMKSLLKRINPSAHITTIPYKKKGPVNSVLQVEKVISDTLPTIVNYCDFNMSWNFKRFKKFVESEDLDGCIICYKGFHPHLLGDNYYAGVLTDDKEYVLEVKEKFSYTKNKMDSWQSCGTYYFKSGRVMKKYFNELVKKRMMCNGEYYVSMVYNLMLKDGLRVKVFPIDYFCQWGTPEDLREYLYWSNYFHYES